VLKEIKQTERGNPMSYYNKPNEYEREFNADSFEKKQVAHSASKRASRKKGFKGAIKLPFEMMTGKRKKEYTMTTEIKDINFENIKWEDFKKLPTSDKLFGIEFLVKKYGGSFVRLASILGANQAAFYGYMSSLGVRNNVKEFDTYSSKEYLAARKGIFNEFMEKKMKKPEEQHISGMSNACEYNPNAQQQSDIANDGIKTSLYRQVCNNQLRSSDTKKDNEPTSNKKKDNEPTSPNTAEPQLSQYKFTLELIEEMYGEQMPKTLRKSLDSLIASMK